MNDPFVHLHVHSEYSFLDGYGHPKDFVSRAKELGQSAIAITDHGNVSAHRKWWNACTAEGIKPILGCEMYVCDDATTRGNRARWHITLLAKNLEGYRNLLKLVTRSWHHGFYYKPRTDWTSLKELSKGLIATSGCPAGRVGHGIAKEGWDDARVTGELKRQASIFEDYYVELSPWDYDDGKKIAAAVYGAAQREGLPMVLTMDAHYPRPEDALGQDVMLCIQNNCLFSDPNRMKFSQQDFCLWGVTEMAERWHRLHGTRMPGTEEMLWNTRKIANGCTFEFPTVEPLQFPYDGDKAELLRQMCLDGMRRRGVSGRPEYQKRFQYEFDLVLSKKFVDYFLIVADMIGWAKDNGILVGPARGSSCGSLMCWALRITEIDPLLHGLMFERFIDINRKDLPDVDVDFDAERRGEVKAYMARKYGEDHVANIATYATFKGKLCVQDIGRVFADKIPEEAIEETKRLIIQRSSADSRAGFTIEDTFKNMDGAAKWLKLYPELGIAKALEGQIRQLGIHAAGLIVCSSPIGDFAASYKTPNRGDVVLSMDYDDAKSIGLLKIDVLGLTALTAIKRILKAVKQNHGKEIDLNGLPLEDKAVYDNFCKQNLLGVFQFEGGSTRQVCRQVAPDCFKELVAVNALSRPGPLHAGGTTSYIERRHGREKAVSVHPLLDEVTKDTYGIVVYQEQVMMAVRNIGKFDWKDVSAIRTAISKKYGDEYFSKKQDEFVVGATSQGMSKTVAEKIWKNVCTFGSWAFNLSHSVAYSVMAYQLMWLKTYYPNEFYAGVIGCENDAEKKRRLVKEFVANGGTLLPVDVNLSGIELTGELQGVRLGLDAVTGMGAEDAKKIVSRRPYKSYIDYQARCKASDKFGEQLLRLGAFRGLNFESVSAQEDLFGAHKAKTGTFDYQRPDPAYVADHCPLAATDRTDDGSDEWIARNVKGDRIDVRDIDAITTRTDVLVIGSTNPNTGFNLKNKMEEQSSRGNVWKPKEGEEHLTKEQYSFLNFELEDRTDTITVRVSYKLYPRYKEMLWAIKPTDTLGVRGMVTGTMRMVFASEIVNLTSIRAREAAKLKLTPEERRFMDGTGTGKKRWKRN